MLRPKHINGHQRLGIVLTALYFLVAISYITYTYQTAPTISSYRDTNTPFIKHTETSAEERMVIYADRDKRYNACLATSPKAEKTYCAAVYIVEPRFTKKPNTLIILLTLIGIPSLGWMIAWLSVSTYRWVREGYNRP